MPYRHLIYAVGTVESHRDTLAYNLTERATGYFQIRPIRLRDYNQKTGSHYRMKDLYKYEISEKIFLYYANQFGIYNRERFIRSWNGSGKQTWEYLKNVKKYLTN